MVLSENLCTTCIELFSSSTESELPITYLASEAGLKYRRLRSSLIEGARSGCRLCRILNDFDAEAEVARTRFQKHMFRGRKSPDPGISKNDAIFHFWLDVDNSILRIRCPENVFAGTLEFRVTVDKDDRLATILPERSTEKDRGSQEAFGLVQRWIKRCSDSHSRCSSDSHKLPTRIIDVSAAPNSLQLIVPQDERAPYVAFSYSWGLSQPVVTTLSTLDDHIRGISYNTLPQTIQDAIITTQALGFKYLWIDALCILQDCAEDKEKEIARMDQIFQNAYLTIAAACSSNSAEGFLRVLDGESPILSLPVRCMNKKDYGLGKMHLLQKQTHFEREPLHERAWTLQEMLLSPRLLLYGRNCVVWKCVQDAAVSGHVTDWNGYCASAGLTTIRLTSDGGIIRPSLSVYSQDIGSFRSSQLAETLPEIFRIWKLVVMDYSTRRVTYSSDKLSALSGIVSYFQKVMQDTYLAGLWSKHLLHELSWVVPRGKRAPVWRAPSWSWMSLDGPVSFTADRCLWYTPLIHIHRCQVTPSDANSPFSQVIEGSLVLSGNLSQTLMDADAIRFDSVDEHGLPIRPPAHRQLWFLELAKCFYLENSSEYSIWGLILIEVDRSHWSQAKEEAFERIGWFEFASRSPSQYVNHSLIQSLPTITII